MQRKKEEEERVLANDDISDFDWRHFDDGITGYKLLLSEFEAVEGMKEHVITRGINMGKTNYKQEWSKSANFYCPHFINHILPTCYNYLFTEHKHYDYSWGWHCKYGKKKMLLQTSCGRCKELLLHRICQVLLVLCAF